MFKRLTRLIKGFLKDFSPVGGELYKPKGRQLVEIIHLILRCQATPKEYYKYRFFEKDKNYSYMMNYLFHYDLNKSFRPALNSPEWAFIFRNKLIFNQYFKHHEFPVTDLYGYYDSRVGFTAKGAPLSDAEQLKGLLDSLKPATLVLKPVGGDCGNHIIIVDTINYDGKNWKFITYGKRVYSFHDLVEHLSNQAKANQYFGYILEGKVEQHEFTRLLNPSSLNTLRIITLLDKDGQAEIILSSLRFGKEGVEIDNTATGGYYFCINPKQGVIAPGLSSYKEGYRRDCRHPITGKCYEGLAIPYWDEVVRICTEAARLAPFCRSVGWDVAIAPTGPVLIEGNDDHAIVTQALFDGFLLQPGVRQKLEQFGLKYPENKLPAIQISRLLDAVSKWSKRKL